MTPSLVVYLSIAAVGAFIMGWFAAWACGAWKFGKVQQ